MTGMIVEQTTENLTIARSSFCRRASCSFSAAARSLSAFSAAASVALPSAATLSRLRASILHRHQCNILTGVQAHKHALSMSARRTLLVTGMQGRVRHTTHHVYQTDLWML